MFVCRWWSATSARGTAFSFVLVGATGAGKSTVIDAITFALYGTVPRWNDQRMITPALAPTATRGVVRLVFDADGQRYAVAREARRSGGKTSRVSMHAVPSGSACTTPTTSTAKATCSPPNPK